MKGLFIYGTLGPEGPNHHIMQEIGGSWIKPRCKDRCIKPGGQPIWATQAWR